MYIFIHQIYIGKSYLLGLGNDATSYVGIKFNWAVEAHAACGNYCKAIPDGVLTTAADKLVKMWSFDGLPLGVLIQSVPEGARSRMWSLEIDVEPAMAREVQDLDDVIVQVQELVKDTDKPELEGFDFSGIDPGEHSIAFSRSELRKRIERTSTILGVDFAINNKVQQMCLSRQHSARQLKSQGNSLKNIEVGPATVRFEDDAKDMTFSSSKTYLSALKELKSSDAAIEFKTRNDGLSKLQIRRKSTKMEEISGIICRY